MASPKPPSMPFAEALRQTRSRADQEAHAPYYVQYEVIEKTFQSELHPNESVLADVINPEIEKVNSHVVACLGALESAAPTSDSELVRCSADCGSVVTFIHGNRNASFIPRASRFRHHPVGTYHRAVSQSLRQ